MTERKRQQYDKHMYIYIYMYESTLTCHERILAEYVFKHLL